MQFRKMISTKCSAKPWPLSIIGGLLCLAFSLSLACRAQEQAVDSLQPSDKQASTWGLTRSVPGLVKLIELQDERLLDIYNRNFYEANIRLYHANNRKAYALPEGMEEIIIRHYSEPKVGVILRELLRADGLRYQSRTLFNLMYAEYDNWQSERLRNRSRPLSSSIIHTDLEGLDNSLLQILKRERKSELQNDYLTLIQFLSSRNYVPLQAVLVRILEEAPAEEKVVLPSIRALSNLNQVLAAETAVNRLSRIKISTAKTGNNRDIHDTNIEAEFNYLIAAIVEIPLSEAKGIEPAILKWVQGARSAKVQANVSDLITFLAKRNYQPAVPLLLSYAYDPAPDKLGQIIFTALQTLNPEKTAEAAIWRIEMLRPQAKVAPVLYEISDLLGVLSRLPATVLIDLAKLETILPESFGEFAYHSVNKIYTARNDARLVSISQRILDDSEQLYLTVPAIIKFGGPEDWQKAKQELERLVQAGKLTGLQARHAIATLNTNIDNPAKYIAERKQRAREEQFHSKLAVLRSAKTVQQQAKDVSPDRYIQSGLAYIEGILDLSKEFTDLTNAKDQLNGVAPEYISLGHVARFSLRQPARALQYYAKAKNSEAHFVAQQALLAIADTYQFDLKDEALAIVEYQQMLKVKPSANPTDELQASMTKWSNAWLEHQIEFLKTGKVFAGPISEDDVVGLNPYLYFGGGEIPLDAFGLAALARPTLDPVTKTITGPPTYDRDAVDRKLRALPCSIFVLTNTFQQYAVLPDAQSILLYLNRHDPAGFSSAGLLGMVMLMDSQDGGKQKATLNSWTQTEEGKPNALLAAAELFSKERKINLRRKIDSRLASPVTTWNLLIASLKENDINTAMLCLTPRMQSRFGLMFTQMSKEALRAMAESFTGFGGGGSMGDSIYEAYAKRGERAVPVQFVRANGMWRVSEM